MRSSQPHYGEALASARALASDASTKLLTVVGDPAAPAIARATAVSFLGRWNDSRSGAALDQAVRDPDALVRMAAIDVLSMLADRLRLLSATPLLTDPIRAVRIEATRALSSNLAEWTAVQRFNRDTASAQRSGGLRETGI